jgi:tryptophan-rich sensory protein
VTRPAGVVKPNVAGGTSDFIVRLYGVFGIAKQERTYDFCNRPRMSPDPNWFGLTFGTLVVALTIVAIITLLYALNRGPIERKTGTGPSNYAVST